MNARNHRNARPRGFTLVELLVVITILVLLVSLLLPVLSAARGQALRVMCAANLRQIHTATVMYQQQNNDFYPCAQDPVSTAPFYWLWMGRGWRRSVDPYFNTSLVDKDHPSILLCLADAATKDKYESTSYAYSLAFYHSPAQIDAMSSAADTYSNPQPSVPQRAMDVRRPSGKILIGEWTSNHAVAPNDNGWWNWAGSRNYLFADGQVRYLAATAVLPARDALPDPNLTIGGVSGVDVNP